MDAESRVNRPDEAAKPEGDAAAAAPAVPAAPPLAPREDIRFGKYRLIRKIAAGGMAQIYLAAIDGPDGFSKSCVVKRILPEYSSLEEFSRMLITEAKVAAMLNHPNIVQVFDFGKIDNDYFIAMEYVEGASLDSIMRRSAELNVPLGVRAAVQIGIPMCESLGYAHGVTMPNGTPLNLVHRDVTPGNILVSFSGAVKLTDFGIVKVSMNQNLTNVGVVKGKFAYMSPEQISNEPLDRRSDVFSLGVVLYEIAVGRWLFRRPEIAAVLLAVANADIPAPSTIIPGFPQEFERILLKALSKERADRYQDTRELLGDLEAFRASRQWTSSTREISALMRRLFPEGPDKDGAVSGVWDEPQFQGTGSMRPAPLGGLDSDIMNVSSVDVIVEDEESTGVSSTNMVAIVLGAVGTLLFWWLVLS